MSEKPVCKNESGACDHPLACGASGKCYWATGIDTVTEVDTGNRTFMNETNDAMLHGPTKIVDDMEPEEAFEAGVAAMKQHKSGVTVAAENNEVELLRDLNDSLQTELKELAERYNKLLLSRPSMESMVEATFKDLADKFRSVDAGSYMNLEIEANISHNGSGFELRYVANINSGARVVSSSMAQSYYEAVARHQRDQAMKPKKLTYAGHESSDDDQPF